MIEESSSLTGWHAPIRADKFRVTQEFLAYDPLLYTITGYHPGVDYGTQDETDVPLYFCADGEVIESSAHHTFGNYFFFYVPSADRTFVYFHLTGAAPAIGWYRAGQACGVAGATGFAKGIHLHLECMRGRQTHADRMRLYVSKEAILAAAEDPDAFLRARITAGRL